MWNVSHSIMISFGTRLSGKIFVVELHILCNIKLSDSKVCFFLKLIENSTYHDSGNYTMYAFMWQKHRFWSKIIHNCNDILKYVFLNMEFSDAIISIYDHFIYLISSAFCAIINLQNKKFCQYNQVVLA